MPKKKTTTNKKKSFKSSANIGAGFGAKAATGINPRLTFSGFVNRQIKKGGRGR